jgi:AraC-like DNA-binding protein
MCLGILAESLVDAAVCARNDFQQLGMRQQTQWIFDYLRSHSHEATSGTMKFTFIIGTVTVCLAAWREVLGISESLLAQLIRKFEGNPHLTFKHMYDN